MKLNEQITFRTTQEIRESIDRLAKKSGKKSSQVINDLLAKALGAALEVQSESNELDSIREILAKQQQKINQLEAQQQEMLKNLAA